MKIFKSIVFCVSIAILKEVEYDFYNIFARSPFGREGEKGKTVKFFIFIVLGVKITVVESVESNFYENFVLAYLRREGEGTKCEIFQI